MAYYPQPYGPPPGAYGAPPAPYGAPPAPYGAPPPAAPSPVIWEAGLAALIIVIIICVIYMSNILMYAADPWSGFWAAPEPYQSPATPLTSYTVGTPPIDLQRVLIHITKQASGGYVFQWVFGQMLDPTTNKFVDGSGTTVPGTTAQNYTASWNGLIGTGDPAMPTMVYNYNLSTGVETLNVTLDNYAIPFSRVTPRTDFTSLNSY